MANPILVVDDDKAYRSGLQKLFERFGHEVETVTCIDDACKRAQNTSIGLFIVEVMLGEEDGITLVSRLRAQKNSAPIVMYSVHDSKIYVDGALRAGADEYIVKTSSLALLIERVEKLLARDGDRLECNAI